MFNTIKESRINIQFDHPVVNLYTSEYQLTIQNRNSPSPQDPSQL